MQACGYQALHSNYQTCAINLVTNDARSSKRRTQQQIISSQILKHKTITVPQQASFMIRPIYYYILFVEFLIFFKGIQRMIRLISASV